jgi:hypothetical protein
MKIMGMIETDYVHWSLGAHKLRKSGRLDISIDKTIVTGPGGGGRGLVTAVFVSAASGFCAAAMETLAGSQWLRH